MSANISRKTTPAKPVQPANELTEEKRSGKYNLTKREKGWLIERPGSTFYTINTCFDITTRLYLLCMNTLDEECKKQNETVEEFISRMMKKAKAPHIRARPYPEKSREPRYNVYYLLFRKAENEVRKKYRLPRTHDTFFYDKDNKELEKLLGEPFHRILHEKAGTIPEPDAAFSQKLNKKFPHRWLDIYTDITTGINENNWKEKLSMIGELPLAKKEAHSEDLYYRAHKLFSEYDNEAAISFYLKYLHADSEEPEKRSLQKVTRAKLFKTAKQEQAFDEIEKNLLATKNLKAALTEVPYIYTKKYEKVELDGSAINTVAARHAKTVTILNKLLKDEEETTAAQPGGKEKKEKSISLSAVQQDFLQLFRQHQFTLDTKVVNAFAKSEGILKNKLIESINDSCYALLNDILIEETGDSYEILEKYYHKIIAS